MRFLKNLLAAGVSALALVPGAHAQGAYPSRTITFITAFAPGNAPDVLVRALAQEITRDTGVTIVIDGRPGAGTFLATQAVARAQPDGHTILVTGSSTFTSNRHVFKKLPYDPVKDFQTVTTLAKGPIALFVNPNVPAKTVPELIALAKRQPGKLTYGEATASSRVAGELLQRGGGIQLTRIPYKSSTQALPDLMGGQIDMIFTDLTALRLAKEGKLRALAIADSRRASVAPELPTLDEVGLRGMDSLGFTLMMMAPAGTPMPVVEKLRAMVTKAARSAQVQPTYASNGMYPFLTTPSEMSALIEKESEMWREMAKAAGMEPQ
ncbi:MAG TPA: tripartite tricarboxylate transporter substrate binding protein [Ramlibacter sp.]|nr:tripartite tricarboxylate transporter substrate binding protein [Ramlibacter sp.]